MKFPWEDLYLRDHSTGQVIKHLPSIPFIKVEITCNGVTTKTEAIIDSGASILLMSNEHATRFGVDISNLSPVEAKGANNTFYQYPYNNVTLKIKGVTFTCECSFTDTINPQFPLLGINSIFNKFKVTIDSRKRLIILKEY